MLLRVLYSMGAWMSRECIGDERALLQLHAFSCGFVPSDKPHLQPKPGLKQSARRSVNDLTSIRDRS